MDPACGHVMGRREARKAATRRSVREHALRLFLTHGYDATTVEQIASAAGVSHMTFFRYFPTKESVVDTDDYDPLFAGEIRARPVTEDAMTAVHRATTSGLSKILPTDRHALLERSRLIFATPALRARQADHLYATQTLIAVTLAARAGLADPTYAMQVQAAASVGAFTTAVAVWTAGGGARDLVDLVDEAFAALHGAAGPGLPSRPDQGTLDP